jgi:hypothetical protein
MWGLVGFVIFIIWSAYRKMVSRSGKTKTTRAGALGRVRDAPERTRIVCRRLARCDPYDSAGDVTTGTIGRRSVNCFTNRLRTTSIRLAVMKPTTRRGNPAAPRWLPTGPLGYCRIRLIPLRRGTTQLRCRPLFLQTEASAPSPSVRGFFLPRKTPPARVCATGSFQVGGSSRSQRDWSRAPSRTLPRRNTAAGVLSYRGLSHY